MHWGAGATNIRAVRKRIFYGWVIVATMFAVNFASMATGALSFGLFVLPMSLALGMSRSQFGWVQTTRSMSAGLSSFVIGRLLDRYGPRGFIVASATVIGACMLTIQRVVSPWQFMVLFGIIGVSGLAEPNSLATSVPVAKWFRRRRGRALALATTGKGAGGITFLPITQQLIGHLGWRGAWMVLATVFMAITMPLASLFLRRQPEDVGLRVDGDSRETDAGTGHSERLLSQTPEVEWTVAEVLRTSALWKLMLVFGLAGLSQGGTSIHRIPYWVEQGFDAQLVSFSFSADAAGAAVMALIAGLLADRFPIRFVAAASYLGFVLAIGLMLDGRNEFFLFSSTIIFGLSVGTGMIVHTYIFAAYYGRAFLGAIRGFVMPLTLITAGLGAPLVGYLRDSTGGYDSSWWMLLSINLLCALTIATITPPRSRGAPTTGGSAN